MTAVPSPPGPAMRSRAPAPGAAAPGAAGGSAAPARPRRQLSLLDSTSLIVGIIIGAGIYQVAPDVARGVGGAWGVMAIWAAGGLLSLCGALGYAELASAWPREGGDYVYLTRAYGRGAGFLFGWLQTVVVRPGDIAVMAFAFATYARVLWDPLAGGARMQRIYAAAAVLALTGVNLLGTRPGKWTQNLLTAVKVLGLLAIVGVAALAPGAAGQAGAGAAGSAAAVPELPPPLPLSLALILVLFTYGGWNEMAYVAAEVRDPSRNISRALVLGTVAVAAIYLLANGAFLHVLGYAGLTGSGAVATDTVAAVLPVLAGRLVAALICISALGAVSGLVFAGARISYAVGADHRAFAWLGRWSPHGGTPARALLLQAAIALTLIVTLGSFVDTLLYTAAAVYLFYLATSLAVVVLRWKEPGRPRPYRVTAYPLPTLLFAAVCVFLIQAAVSYRPLTAAVAGALLLLGWPVYRLSSRGSR